LVLTMPRPLFYAGPMLGPGTLFVQVK